MFLEGLGVEKYFVVQRQSFRQIGINILGDFDRASHPGMIGFINVITYSMWACNFYYCCEHIDEFSVEIDAYALFVGMGFCISKTTIFYYKRRSMVRLVQKIHKLSSTASKSEMKLLTKANKTEVLMSGIYNWVLKFLLVAFLVAPFGFTLLTYMQTGEFRLFTPYRASYPFDYTTPINYLLLYIWSTLCIYWGCQGVVSTDTLFLWCVFNLRAQFQIVQLKLSKLSDAQVNGKLLDSASTLETGLKHCIVYHQQILALIDQFNESFAYIFLTFFTLNSIQLCLIVYQIVGVTSLANLPFLITFLLESLGELLMFCYGGQVLENEVEYDMRYKTIFICSPMIFFYQSENVASTICEKMEWQWSLKAKKMCLLWLMRSQRPCKLSGIFYTANLRLFMTVVHTAGSYMMLLYKLED